MKKAVVLLVSTLMLGVSASAMADSNRWDNHHDYKHRYDQRYDRYEHRDQPRWSNGDRGNHYGQRINFKRGERLPSEYRNKRFIVSKITVITAYTRHLADITGCEFKVNMYWWIRNIVCIALHKQQSQKQAFKPAFLFRPIHHLEVAVFYSLEVAVHAFYHESPKGSAMKQNEQQELPKPKLRLIL